MKESNTMVHILIVDDDPSFRSAQARLLRSTKFRKDERTRVWEASSGQEALDLIKTTKVDCILLDYNMPGGSGLDWLKKFEAREREIAVVMITGQGSEQLAVEAMKNGALDYLVKGSIDPEALERAILNALEKIELRRTINAQRAELISAERQRVMIESLGTACHHIGQPATVISAYLEMMRAQETDTEMMEMIVACQEASESMVNILKDLQQVSQYRTTPYLPDFSGNSPMGDDAIIDLG